MRIVQLLFASVVVGVVAGLAWSAMLPARTHLHIPKASKPAPIVIPESQADKEWQARASEAPANEMTSAGAPQQGAAVENAE